MNDTPKRTPLYDVHLGLGAKMVPFAGYEMPVQYPAGITAEHHAVREVAGLFDVSHMGEFLVRGPQAIDLVQRVSVNDAASLVVGQCQYSAMCAEDGGIRDDLVVYRMADHYMLVVNASRREEDWAWISEHSEALDVALEDRSDDMGPLAPQGPRAQEMLDPLTDVNLDGIAYYHFAEGSVAGCAATISRTGYTGEDGFELYVAEGDTIAVWNAVLERGRGAGLLPSGLGARDSLRLEVGFALYGNELDEEHTPLAGRLGWVVKWDKGEFCGRDALVRQKEAGVPERLVGIRLTERGFPRPGYPIVHDGHEVGSVTSGTLSPSLGYGVALGYVPAELSSPDTQVGVRVRDRVIPGVVVRLPFYTEGSVRR
ncbi:MAG: glycine cleavage system aminomethyltransferase GcvT [Gemmatimonadetes bacterium]|nr:glycine cleavage system aminomethyltransferase GcvT [Gemmatimonadota bacterium]